MSGRIIITGRLMREPTEIDGLEILVGDLTKEEMEQVQARVFDPMYGDRTADALGELASDFMKARELDYDLEAEYVHIDLTENIVEHVLACPLCRETLLLGKVENDCAVECGKCGCVFIPEEEKE